MAEEASLLSSGALAKRLGCSVALIQKLEKGGVLPPAMTIEGNPRRVWPARDWDVIRAQYDQRRRKDRVAS